MASQARCPCGREREYALCCGRFHAGAEPEDAESLMRSRFCAFIKQDAAYLWKTLHPEHEERGRGWEAFARGMKAHFADRIVYQKLEVLEALAPDDKGVAQVLFIARVARRGKDVSFSERSYFAHDGSGWRYLAGQTAEVKRP